MKPKTVLALCLAVLIAMALLLAAAVTRSDDVEAMRKEAAAQSQAFKEHKERMREKEQEPLDLFGAPNELRGLFGLLGVP